MQTATHHSAVIRGAATAPTFIPLALETRPAVNTAAAAYYLSRRPQTLRGWHCHGDYAIPELRPITVNGRLLWPVSGIKKALGVPA